MHIVVKADAQQKEEFLLKGIPADIRIDFIHAHIPPAGADAYFDLCFEEEGFAFGTVTDVPVFVNAVTCDRASLPAHAVRLNAWNGFLKRDILEIAAPDAQIGKAALILNRLNWKYRQAPDVPGMIAARVIAMIVNEAYFGLGEAISSKEDMDTAMKLGTNYPFGPFEWSEKIGLPKIYALLKKLNETDNRYAVAPALENEL